MLTEDMKAAAKIAARIAAPLFRLQGWCWGMNNRVSDIPTEEEIAESFHGQLSTVIKEGHTLSSSGRLRVVHDVDGEITLCIEVATLLRTENTWKLFDV